MKKSTAVDASHHHHYNNNIATTTYYYIYENTILYIGASVWPKQKKTVCRKCEHFFFFCLDFYLPKKDEDEKTKVVWGKSECAPFPPPPPPNPPPIHTSAVGRTLLSSAQVRRINWLSHFFLCEIIIPPDLKYPPFPKAEA